MMIHSSYNYMIEEKINALDERRLKNDGKITIAEIDSMLLSEPNNSHLLFTKFCLIIESDTDNKEEVDSMFKLLVKKNIDTYIATSLGLYYDLMKNDYAKAIGMYQLAIERDVTKTNFWAHIYLMSVYQVLYDFENAKKIIDKAKILFDNNFLIDLKLADILLDNPENKESAFNILDKIPEDNRNESWYRSVAECYMYNSKFSTAHEYADKALALSPNSLYSYLTKIRIFLYEGRDSSLIELCDTALQKFPNAAMLFYNKGLGEMGLGNTSKAEESFLKAIDVSTEPTENILFFYFQVIYMYLNSGMVQKANDFFQKNLSVYIGHSDVFAHYILLTYYISFESFQVHLKDYCKNYPEQRGYLEELLNEYGIPIR